MLYWIVALAAFLVGIVTTVCFCAFLMTLARGSDEDIERRHKEGMGSLEEGHRIMFLNGEHITRVAEAIEHATHLKLNG